MLAILTEFGAAEPPSVTRMVLADFLLQHPSLLGGLARRVRQGLPEEASASAAEIESSEEALLAWKRAAGARPLMPMLGRLIARGLVRIESSGTIALTPRGKDAAVTLSSRANSRERTRLATVSRWVKTDEEHLRGWLRADLAERSPDGE